MPSTARQCNLVHRCQTPLDGITCFPCWAQLWLRNYFGFWFSNNCLPYKNYIKASCTTVMLEIRYIKSFSSLLDFDFMRCFKKNIELSYYPTFFISCLVKKLLGYQGFLLFKENFTGILSTCFILRIWLFNHMLELFSMVLID